MFCRKKSFIGFEFCRRLSFAALLYGAVVLSARCEPVETRILENRFICFSAPDAVGIAVGDNQRKLAVGFAAGSSSNLWLLSLDDKGNIIKAPPQLLALPPSSAEDNRRGSAVSMMFHPTSPVLYVWRHLVEPAPKKDAANTFAHLVVFDLADSKKPAVAFMGGRGDLFAGTNMPAFMGMDPAGRRLFVPDLRIKPAHGAIRLGAGYFPLNTNGIPLVIDGKEQFAFTDLGDFQTASVGFGFFAVNERVISMGAQGGVLTWDTIDRRVEISRVLLPVPSRQAGFAGGESNRFYWAGEGSGAVCSMRHADGYPSLLPVKHVVENAGFCSSPMRMFGNSPLLAIGGEKQVHLIGLNADGGFSGKDKNISIPGMNNVCVLGYSTRHDRLYIPVKELP